MNLATSIVNRFVRAYLRNVPITEGKKQLLGLTQNWILPDSTVVTFPIRHGFRLTGNLRNPEHRRMYFYGDYDERYEVNNVRQLLRAGDVCWDIGANIGFYTCLFATLVGPTGQIVAFEPLRQTCELLRANVALNGLRNVTVLAKAVGASIGTRSIYFQDPDAGEGTASLKATAPGSWAQKQTVETDTVDHLSTNLPAPDFIKIDVEGCQLEVLTGGTEFFAAHSPMVMAELGDPDRGITQASAHRLRDYGYRIYEFSKRSLKECGDVSASRKRNFFMVKPDSPYGERVEAIASGVEG